MSKREKTIDAEKEATAPQTSGPSGKLGQVVELLRGPKGATVADLMTATGWQAHSVRGAIAGALKKKHGFTISSEKADGERRYRIDETLA